MSERVKATPTYIATTGTVKAHFYLGVKSITNAVLVYKGGAATGGNEIGGCAAAGEQNPPVPIIVEPVAGVEQVHVTGGPAVVYTSL
jgi:hypothetical protein